MGTSVDPSDLQGRGGWIRDAGRRSRKLPGTESLQGPEVAPDPDAFGERAAPGAAYGRCCLTWSQTSPAPSMKPSQYASFRSTGTERTWKDSFVPMKRTRL